MTSDVLSIYTSMSDVENDPNTEMNPHTDEDRFENEAPSSGNVLKLQAQSTSRRNAVKSKSVNTAKNKNTANPGTSCRPNNDCVTDKYDSESDQSSSEHESRDVAVRQIKQKQHKRRSRARNDIFSSSSGSSSSSSSSSTSDSEENDDDSSVRKRKQKAKRTERGSRPSIERSITSETISNGTVYERFNPVKKVINTNKLSAEMQEYVDKSFHEFIKDDDIESSILDTAPVPECNALKTKSMDDFVEPLLERRHKSFDKGADKGIASIQTRILRTMGPLSKLWTIIDGLRQQAESKASVDDVDIHSMCNLVEKTVCLVGQSSLTVDFHRRLNTIIKMCGDYKTAKTIISENSDALANSGDRLFGDNFVKVLKKAGKKRKEAEEVADTLQPRRKKSKKLDKHYKQTQRYPTVGYSGYRNHYSSQSSGPHNTYPGSYRGDNYRHHNQPFHRRPSGKNRGSGGRRRYPGNPRYDRWVQRANYQPKGGNSRQQITVRKLVRVIFTSGIKHNNPSCKKSRTKNNRSFQSTSNRRKTQTLSHKLASNNKGSIHSADSSGCKTKFHTRASSGTNSISSSVKSKRKECTKRRNSKSAEKICCRGGTTHCHSVYKQHVHRSQKRRGSSSNYKSAASQSIYTIPSFQDGGSFHGSRSTPTNEFHVQARSQGCLSSCSSPPPLPELSTVLVGQETVPIQVPPIRPSSSATNIHKTAKTHCRLAQKSRCKINSLSRRYAVNSRQSRNAYPASRHHAFPSPIPGTSNKQRKVTLPTNSDNLFSRFRNKLGKNAVRTARLKSLRNKTKMQRNSDKSVCFSSRNGKSDWEVSINNAGYNSSQSAMSIHADDSNRSSHNKPELRKPSTNKQRSKGRTVLVDQSNRTVQRPINNNPRPRYVHNNRCFKLGVGGNRRVNPNRGSMDSVRKRIAHKRKRITGYSASYTVACKIKRKYFNSLAIRQHYNCCPYKQDGGNEVRRPKPDNEKYVGMVSKPEHFPDCRISPRQIKHSSRLGIQKCRRRRRLDVKQINFPTNYEKTRQLRNRSVRITSKLSTTKVCQLETRSRRTSNRCISNALEQSEGIRISSFLSGRSLSRKNNKRESNLNFSNSNLASPTMVSNVTTNDRRFPNTPAHPNKSSVIPIRSNTSTVGKPKSASGSVESFGGPPETYKLSDEAAALYTQAWRPGTQASYKSAWGKWSSWCNSRKVDPVHAPLEFVIEFLTSLFHENKQYRTINTYRSAISRGHALVDGIKIGQHPHTITHMRAIFNLRTPCPRYQDSWDVDTVLEFMKNLGDNANLTIKMLTLKVTTLLALTSAGRASEINQLNIKLMKAQPKKLTFLLSKPTKTCKPGKTLPSLSFHEFEESNLCVVKCLKHYISRTQEFRKNPDRVDRTWLLLSMVKPHHPVTTSSVSRWVKQTLSLAGINTDIFKAHSTRAAATSKAFNSGVSVHDILKQARWSNASTFTRFYCKPLTSQKSDFQHSVLTRR